MKVTLLKAAKLRNALQLHLDSLLMKPFVVLNHNICEVEDVESFLNKEIKTMSDNATKAAQVRKAKFAIRAFIAQANHDSGVGTLMNELAYKQEVLNTLEILHEHLSDIRGEVLYSENIEGIKKKLIEKKQTEDKAISSGGSLKFGAENFKVILVKEGNTEELEDNIASLQLELVEMQEKLASLNNAVEVELDSDTVSVLRVLKLIR